MLLNDIETYLTSFGAYTGDGVTFTIRRGFVPETVDSVIVIKSIPGMPDVRAMGPSAGAPLMQREGLEILVRGPKDQYMAAYEAAETVNQRLSHAAGLTLGGRSYRYIHALHPPFCDEQDTGGRWEFSQSFIVYKERG